MSSRILFLREIPGLSEKPEFVRVLAEVVHYDVSNNTIYVRDPTQKKGSGSSSLLVKVDISEFRLEQITGFKNAMPFQCIPGEYLTILGETYKVNEKEGEEEGTCSQIGIKARYINCAVGTDIPTYAKAIEVRRKYCKCK